MFYYNPYSKRQRRYNIPSSTTSLSTPSASPVPPPYPIVQPTKQELTKYRQWQQSQYKLYNPYSFQPTYNPYGYQSAYNPLRTPSIGGAYTLPGYSTYGEPYYRAQQSRYTGAPRVTRGANMTSRPSPYQSPYQPPYQSPYQQPYGGQSMSLNQIRDIFTLAQNIGADQAMIRAYLQERAKNPYAMNIADFLRWWGEATTFGSPFLPPEKQPYFFTGGE